MGLYRLCWYPVRLVFRLYGRSRIEGHENIPSQGPVILASNHLSMADPPLLGGMVWRPVRFMAKEELFRVPVLSPVIRALGTFPVRRRMADRVALRQALKLLEAGEVLGVFPEGTRSPDGRLQELELGITFIALKSQAPVVPIAIQGTEKMLPAHKILPKPARLLVRAGPLITFPHLYGRKETSEIREEVARSIRAGIAHLLDEPYRPLHRESPL